MEKMFHSFGICKQPSGHTIVTSRSWQEVELDLEIHSSKCARKTQLANSVDLSYSKSRTVGDHSLLADQQQDNNIRGTTQTSVYRQIGKDCENATFYTSCMGYDLRTASYLLRRWGRSWSITILTEWKLQVHLTETNFRVYEGKLVGK